MDTQAELVRFFPSNPPPSRILSGVYRLALSLVNNDYRRLDTFLAQRAYYTPIRQEIHLSGIDWNEEYQCSSPLDKCFNPNLFHPDPEPRPRLIDRMQLITEDAAREYLDILSRDLSDVRFATIFGRYFEELTLSEIGARRGCKIENIRSRRYVAIQQLRYRHPPSAQLRIDIFGADTIGKICNEQD